MMRRLWRRFRRQSPSRSRAVLIEHKHRLEGEIRSLAAEANRLRARGGDVSAVERRLEALRSEHYQTRMAIDRAPIE